MPVRIPKAGRTEVICFGAAGVAGFAPFYFILPGAEERLAAQTLKWAPRWERNITFFKSPVERGMQRITPPVARTVQKIDEKLPLEKIAQRADRRVKKNFDLLGWPRT
ncbi:hypothetical protein QBC46DRAFT_130114 [Diplogelasinospora grovesii]|uniref:4-coumarate:coenzyme A ligase n=1 Tax=Diplogelasinospora grovesii TaxID=303347 RepID=A0AAN6S4H4_9PEZI|nr:hypothetical protein QBC46DRAFT_130114 [Diplogelasinospora grovesii]